MSGNNPLGGVNPTDVTGGGTNAPWNWGVSPFDLSSIVQAFNNAKTATTNRYNQFGEGGSTMEGQDLGTTPSATGGQKGQEEALIGKEQTANVGNPALNPALQPQINEQIGGNTSTAGSSALGSLAGQALGLGASALGGTAAGTAAAGASGDVVAGLSDAVALGFL
jgi:hypothetical protein